MLQRLTRRVDSIADEYELNDKQRETVKVDKGIAAWSQIL